MSIGSNVGVPTRRRPVRWPGPVFLLIVAAAGCGSERPEPTGKPSTSTHVVSRPARPAPRVGEYVGSQTCATCHPDISADYQTHPMAQSLHAVENAPVVEEYPSGRIDIPGPRRYHVERSDGRVWHHESLRDADGELLYDQAEEVHYALGSGQQGRSYLLNKDGVLYQSPLGWYSAASRWDLSPGYRPEGHSRFTRRVGDGCLYCHAGRVARSAKNRYVSPVFHEPSIGCERCHGPGGGHVAFHDAQGAAPTTDPIVNPAKLDTTRRESVCNQCHLQGEHVIPRYGRDFWDFRPGDRLDDTLICLVGKKPVGAVGRSPVVSQVEQMRRSRCYQASNAALGCTSCHDPHRKIPEPERASYYRERCLSCHADHGCALPVAQREAPPASGSCIHCHMPAVDSTDVAHTAQTDHRILRQPAPETPPIAKSPPGSSLVDLQPFGDAAEHVPKWEISRAKGTALMLEAARRRDSHLALRAFGHLVPPGAREAGFDAILTALRRDIPVLNELTRFYLLRGQPERARRCCEEILRQDPQNEAALAGLVIVYRQTNALPALKEVLDRLVELLPAEPQWHLELARLHWQMDQPERAAQGAERVLELDPTRTDVRRWLVDDYRRRGQNQRSQRHAAILRGIEQATNAAPNRSPSGPR